MTWVMVEPVSDRSEKPGTPNHPDLRTISDENRSWTRDSVHKRLMIVHEFLGVEQRPQDVFQSRLFFLRILHLCQVA